MNRTALVWFAAGAGIAAATSILSSQLIFKRAEMDFVMVVYEPPSARDREDWGSMAKDQIVVNNLLAARVVRECGVKNFNSSTVNDGLNFTEFTLDMHAIKELNCILDHAYIEHLPLRIKDNDQHEVSATATAIATAKIGSKE